MFLKNSAKSPFSLIMISLPSQVSEYAILCFKSVKAKTPLDGALRLFTPTKPYTGYFSSSHALQ